MVFKKNLMNRLFKFIFPIALALFMVVSCQNSTGQRSARSLTVVFYNVENLFDTVDDPRVNDNDFMPDGKNEWTTERYLRKLQDLSSVLSETGGRNLPFLIGLCEVENRTVVEDLAISGKLKRGRYQVVHQDSPDARGIDVALMYRPDEFSVSAYYAVPVMLPDRSGLSTRDILYVKGNTKQGEELHIFVNHWPSRAGGLQQTEANRIAAAEVLRGKTDSLFSINPDVKIIIMGDLNDTPDNKSLREVLGAVHPEKHNHPSLVNLMYPSHHNGEGSYNYRGSWDMLDNIIVSSALLRTDGLRVENNQGYIFQRDWMTYTNPQGQQAPNRTYVGPRYVGGISDHFPVYIRLVRKNDAI
jgi:predicted extracellular nuclease